jgi:MtN3 and saliva related transmembrane protein
MTTELIVWVSLTVLLVTIGREVYSQWRGRSSQGISRWLFIGKIIASIGLLILHRLLRNWVFVASNMLMLFEQWIYLDITNDARERLDKQRIAPA